MNKAKPKSIKKSKKSIRNVVRSALRNESINKPEHCQKCGAGGVIEGHHEDYSRPLDLMWLCVPCHRRLHKLKNIINKNKKI